MPSRRAPSANGRVAMVRTPFVRRTKERTRQTTDPGKFLEVPEFWEISWKSATRDDGQHRHRWRWVRQPELAHLQATFGMAGASTTLVAATPPRPCQDPACGRRSGPDQSCEQMTHFGNGQRNRSRLGSRLRGRRRGSRTMGRCANSCKIRKSQHDECDMSVPSDEATDLIVIQPRVLAVFKVFLNMPVFHQWL